MHSRARFCPVSRPRLTSFTDGLNGRNSFVLNSPSAIAVPDSRGWTYSIDELSELFLALWTIRDHFPLVLEGRNEFVHVSLQVRTDPQLIFQQDFLEPLCYNCEFVRGS